MMTKWEISSHQVKLREPTLQRNLNLHQTRNIKGGQRHKESFGFKQKQPQKSVIALCYSSWDQTQNDYLWFNWRKTKYSKLCQPFLQLLMRVKGPLVPLAYLQSSLSNSFCFLHHHLLKFNWNKIFNKITRHETHLYTIIWYFAFQLLLGFVLGVKIAVVGLIDRLRILANFS